MIQIEHVYKTFDIIQAVVDVSLTIERKSIVGLIGPNGAGKTSLLKILATLYKPDRGTVFIDGINLVNEVGRVRPKIGFMPNDFGRFGDMTIREYIRFFGVSTGVSWKKIDQTVDEILELTDLTTRAEQLVIEGSTGIKQRACLAKTLVHNPEILLLDEPASGLDPRARIEIRELLKELKSLNKTILLSSHILSDLEEICTHFAFIDRGRLLLYASRAELLDKQQQESISYRLEVRKNDSDSLKNVLSTQGHISILLDQEGHFEIASKEWNGNQLLQKIIDSEIEVLGFGKQKKALEDIFLQITERFS
ncbi:MAG: ABC transporter ATP-binding protein [Planctomycetota bacterium]